MRNVGFKALVGLVIIAVGIGIMVVLNGDTTSPTAQNTEAPNTSISARPTVLTQDNWAAAWKVDPKTGDLSDGPGTFKEVADLPNDSEETTNAKETFNGYVVDSSFFDCYDGRNSRDDEPLTWSQLNEFTPCVNGSTHLRLSEGQLRLAFTTENSTQLHNAVVGGLSDSYQYNRDNFNIVLREDRSGAKPVYLVGYEYPTTLNMFEFYAKVNDGPWELVINLNDQHWGSDENVELLLTWQDPAKPMIDASLPVGFNWAQAQKFPYLYAN